jgi:hypothetical protein
LTRPNWGFVVWDPSTNTAIGELAAPTSRQISYQLNDASLCNFQMNGRDPQALWVLETSTDIVAIRNGHMMYRGRLGSSSDSMDENTHSVSFSAIDYRGMLSRRMVPGGGLTYTNVDQATIAWNLVTAAQSGAGGNWNITRGVWTPSVNRTLTAAGGAYIDATINDLSNLDNGFDWEINAHLALNVWPVPTKNIYTGLGRGQSIGMNLTYGDNVQHAARTTYTTNFANVVRYSGSNTVGAVTKDIVSEAIYSASFGTQGRWETQEGNTDITSSANLDAMALAELTRTGILLPAYQLTLTKGWWDPTQLFLGDIVQVNVKSGRLNDHYQARVSQIDVYINDTSNTETVVVTVGTQVGNLLNRIVQNEKILYRSTRTGT